MKIFMVCAFLLFLMSLGYGMDLVKIKQQINEHLQRYRRDVPNIRSVESEVDEASGEMEELGDHDAVDVDKGWYREEDEETAEEANMNEEDNVDGGLYLRTKPKKRKDNKKKKQKPKNKNENGPENNNTDSISTNFNIVSGEPLSSEDVNQVLATLARQSMLQQLAFEENLRVNGGSGLRQVRVNRQGTRPYFTAHHTSKAVGSIHDHANNIRTVGMGEFEAVLNGIAFRTRHNDYRLKQPHSTSVDYHATEDIQYPDVPPEVTNQPTVEAQIEKMRLWFKAFKDQDTTIRDYRQYFKPLLCYLEGAWTLSEELEESFDSDRHFLDAISWFDLQEKIRFTSYTGRKSQLENFAYLPTTITQLIDNIPRFAQWNYRILCHKLSRDVPLNKFRLTDDLAARFSYKIPYEEAANYRSARFQLHDHGMKVETQEMDTSLDVLMGEVPGKDNYQGVIYDETMGATAKTFDDKDVILNAAFYHRYFQVDEKGAMGIKTRKRGYSDPSLFVALTKQSNIAAMNYTHCTGKKNNEVCTTYTQRVSYAIPLEVIFMTPLLKWNPYNIVYKGEYGSIEGKTVHADGRNGAHTEEGAYDGSNSKRYYITPSEFFKSKDVDVDPADTSKDDVGVLDKDGNLRKVRASGTRIICPLIDGVGQVRLRYPIMPVYGEGSAIWKEVSALKDAVMRMEEFLYLFQKIPPFGETNDTVTKPDIVELALDQSTVKTILKHSHQLEISRADYNYLKATGTLSVPYFTSIGEGHDHEIQIRWNTKRQKFKIARCGGETKCWDGHKWLIE